ncbi:MAG: A24 family peptidase C-terminal domain-containing protein [archaeon]
MTVSFLLVTVMLVIASLQDLKNRSVPDKLWLFFGFIALIQLFFVFKFYGSSIENFFLSVTFTGLVVLMLFVLGKASNALYLGEADLKAVFLIGLIAFNPWYTALITLFVALSISLILPLYYLFRNLSENKKTNLTGMKKVFLFLTAKKMKITDIKDYFTSPLEEISIIKGKELRKPFLTPLIEPASEIKRLKKLVSQGKIKNSLWVTPLQPFQVFLLSSILVLLFFFSLSII